MVDFDKTPYYVFVFIRALGKQVILPRGIGRLNPTPEAPAGIQRIFCSAANRLCISVGASEHGERRRCAKARHQAATGPARFDRDELAESGGQPLTT